MRARALPARSDRGVALIATLLAMSLLSALALGLALTISVETRVAASFRDGVAALHAADAAAVRAANEILAAASWDGILAGTAPSTFSDGPPGTRVLADGSMVDLEKETALVRCGEPTCSVPASPGRPVWQLFSSGPFADVSPGAIASAMYLVVWVADDPLDNDGNPFVDGDVTHGENPGRGLLALRAHAYGPGGAFRAVDLTIARTDARAGVATWREVR